ncbi:MAG: glycosyltransferase family 4 protein [Acidobacteria bacterium]|nr:glycosyltransferase family 4 protein [Acidobacteriota bacterium]MCA1627887.1 glycosyltransferase family 4 protein [Acidobacteriota bacterium]
MKVVLLALSGDSARCHAKLVQLYPQATVETISRAQFETGSLTNRLAALRARQADVFAIATERLAWQRGQNLFMLFGALAGAREVVVLDSHDGWIKRTRGDLLARAPLSVGAEALNGVVDFAQSRIELRRLEQAVGTLHTRARERATHSGRPGVVYLRATPGPGTQAGGAASHMKGVIEAVRVLGVELEIISNDAIAGFDVADPRFTIIPPETVGGTRALFEIHNNLVFTRAAVPLIERARPDFIYQRYARFSWAGVAAAVRTGRPLFLEYNGSEVWVGRHWDRVGSLGLLERYERLNLLAAARIFVVSEVERRNLEARGVAAEKIVLNPNAVDVELFQPGINGKQVRDDLGINSADLVAGFVGTFGPWHGVVELAQAIKLLPRELPVRFLIVGSGSLHGEVERLLHAERESGKVIFTGAVAHDRVPALLDACDILIAPHVPLADGTDFFGSPTKIFEYMAMGKAIVASRLGQIGEVLSHEETALLVEPGNGNELANAIVRLVESEALRERLGPAAREVAVKNHTWGHNARRVLEAYESWAAGK